MTTKRRTTMPRRRSKWLWTLLLCLALSVLIAGSALARTGDQGEVADPATAKPVVTLQGNLVKEKGKATGFYELALCVRSGCIVTDDTGLTGVAPGTKIDQTVFWDYIDAHPEDEDKFTVQYYPFRTASAAVYVNTDVLTAVNWDIQKVTYAGYTAGTGYDAPYNIGYPMGINTDPAVQGYTIPEALAFPDITGAFYNNRIAIDVEGDPRMGTIMGLVEHYDDIKHTALVTLAAHAPDTDPVILKQPTELVVARFAYDLNRYKAVEVDDSYLGSIPALRNSVTGDSGDVGFWMGWDKSHKDATAASKTDLTWLGESTGTFDFSGSDGMIASTQADQSVWVHMGANAGTLQDDETYFYYYLGAEVYKLAPDAEGTIFVDVGNPLPAQVDHVALPDTEGATVLTKGKDQNPVPGGSDTWTQADYTYFRNLLRLQDKTLVLKLVNQPTFKKPTGGFGGTQVLFYDWDDTLIGAMIVGDGDVRAEVNAYIEENMVHPDLAASKVLETGLGGTVPDYSTIASGSGTAAEEEYRNLLDSKDREWTYRGKYSSKVDGTGVSYTEDPSDAAYDPLKVGKEYPLTNKLDYVFYRHLNTESVQEYQKSGVVTTDRYITTEDLTSNQDAAMYPWVYGWAVVEDNSAINKASWQVRRDAAKVGDVWTTFNVGELEGMDPYATATGNVPLSLPAGATAVTGTTVGAAAGTLGREPRYPAFIDASTATAPSKYAYKLSTADGNGYLRFADFSAVDKELTKDGQNVLIVKAVYEPGTELMDGSYRMIAEPYYSKLNERAAANGGAYSAVITLERTNTYGANGYIRGARRARDPAVRMDTTVDAKWIEENALGVKHNLSNASVSTAQGLTETTFVRVDIDNGEEITFTLPLSARMNKVDYWIIEQYNFNFVAGGQRSDTNYGQYGGAHVIDNYFYDTDDVSVNDAYFDKSGFYYPAARYDVRNGTHGFVLYGTLNYAMELATRQSRGQITRIDFDESVNRAVLQDLNLFMDNGATEPTALNYTTFGTKIIAAAKACEAVKGADYWDYEHDCAQLTYHQLQYYLDNNALIPRSQSENLTATHFDWCHLHIDCFDDKGAVQLPENWDEIVTAARGDSDAQATIGQVKLDNLKNYTYLRSDAKGSQFASSLDLQRAVVDAVRYLDVAGVNVTWTTVQYYIINSTVPSSEAAADTAAMSSYWWYDGTTNLVTPGSLESLMTATDDYFNNVTLKDGKTFAGGFTAKLSGVESVFNANATAVAGGGKITDDWKRMTNNPVKAYVNYDGESYGDKDGTGETTPFDNYTEYINYWMDFQTVARAAGVTANDAHLYEYFQYYVLHTEAGETVDTAALTTLKTAVDAGSGTDYDAAIAEFNGYWWKDGNKRLVVSSIGTLLRAARQVNDGGDSGPLDKVDMALLESLYLRGSKTGQTFASLGMTRDQVIGLVKDAAALHVDPTDSTSDYLVTNWPTLQYYINHGNDGATKTDMNMEAAYYWWADGKDGTLVDIAGGIDADDRLGLLMQAIVRSVYYGDPKALSGYTDATKIFDDMALLAQYPGSVTLGADGLPDMSVDATIRQTLEFTSVSDLVNAVDAAMSAGRTALGITTDYTLPNLDWWQIQYAILNGGTYIPYKSAATSDYQIACKQYWWHDSPTYEYNQTGGWDPQPTDVLFPLIETYYSKNMSAAAASTLKKAITVEMINNMELRLNKTGTKTWDDTTLADFRPAIVQLAKDAKATYFKDWDGKGTDSIRLTWAQVQIYVVTYYSSGTGDLQSPEDAIKTITTSWKWNKKDSGKSKAYIPTTINLPTQTIGEPVIVVIPEAMGMSMASESLQSELAMAMAEDTEMDIAERIAKLEEIIQTAQAQLEIYKAALEAAEETQTAEPEATDPAPAPVTRPATRRDTRVERAETPAGEDAHVRGEAPARRETPAAQASLGEAIREATPAAPVMKATTAKEAEEPERVKPTVQVTALPLLFALVGGHTYYSDKKKRR